MRELVPMNEYGIFADAKEVARVDSRYVAEVFEKDHKHVMRTIRTILDPESGLSEEFRKSNFGLTHYTDSQGRKKPYYCMTRDGFTYLVMGFTGRKAAQFKEAYIKRFNEMENFILQLRESRLEHPMFTEQITLAHEEPKPYHFSNEYDMIYRIVLGKSARQFRVENGISKGEVIKPYLTETQLEHIDKLIRIDTGLMLAMPDYDQRKRHLEWYYMKHLQKNLCEST
ncbi:MAG: Rha family transcriptional regulator [Clostridia bacterium]|nr:Rha family transcriptional regulator [Clostridia bacterium]